MSSLCRFFFVGGTFFIAFFSEPAFPSGPVYSPLPGSFQGFLLPELSFFFNLALFEVEVPSAFFGLVCLCGCLSELGLVYLFCQLPRGFLSLFLHAGRKGFLLLEEHFLSIFSPSSQCRPSKTLHAFLFRLRDILRSLLNLAPVHVRA